MANRIPLVLDTTTSKIKELPSGDNLNLAQSSIIDAINISATGTITANTLTVTNLNAAGGSIAAVALTNDYADLDNKPNLATVATSGSYNDLTDIPTGVAADWNTLTNKPTLPTKLSQLINDTNYITNASIAITTDNVTNLAEVGRTGSYTDLIDASELVTQSQIVGGTLTVDVNNTGDLEGNVLGIDGTTLLVDANNNAIVGDVDATNVDATTLTATTVYTSSVIANDSAVTISGDVSLGIDDQDTVTIGSPNNASSNTYYGEVIGDIKGSIFADDSTAILDAVNGVLYGRLDGDMTGSVFSDDSTVMVDGVNKSIHATNVYATTHWGDLSKNGSILSVTANSGIQLLPNGVFNIPNATTIDIDATGTIDITATGNLTIGSSSGTVSIDGYVSVADLKTALQDGSGDYAAFKAWVLANL